MTSGVLAVKPATDYGFNSYSTVIQTRREIVDGKADMVQRFVYASIIGWYNYLYGDNRAAPSFRAQRHQAWRQSASRPVNNAIIQRQ